MPDEKPQPKFAVSSGLPEAKHWRKMGSAIWVYLVLLDWQTNEDGTVMRGETIQAEIISARLGCNERTVRRELGRLDSEGYIRRNRSGSGWLIWISNPKKAFRQDRARLPDRNVRSARTDLSDHDQPAGQICPISRTDLSDLTVITSLKGIVNKDLNKQARARGAAQASFGPDFEPQTELDAIFAEIRAGHPKGRKQRPSEERKQFDRKAKKLAIARKMLDHHRRECEIWANGTGCPELFRWFRNFDPDAEDLPEPPIRPNASPNRRPTTAELNEAWAAKQLEES